MYERYQKLLDEKGLKNADVSRGARVSNMTLSDWKNGKTIPKTDTLKKICSFLNVSIDYLLGSENYVMDKETNTWEYVVPKKDMDILVEAMSDNENADRLIAYAKKLIEIKNMENI